MTEFALARVSMACRHQRVRFHLTGSKEFDWPNGHSKLRNKVTFYPFFTQGAFFQYHQGILVTFIMSSDTTGNSNTSWGWWNSRFMGSSLHPVWSWAPSWLFPKIVTRSSAAMLWTMQDKQVLIFHEKIIHLPIQCQCEGIIYNIDIYIYVS